MFLTLHRNAGDEVVVNFDHVIRFEQRNGLTRLYFSTDPDPFHVVETAESIANKLRAMRQRLEPLIAP